MSAEIKDSLVSCDINILTDITQKFNENRKSIVLGDS